jgi:hypothetical protein
MALAIMALAVFSLPAQGQYVFLAVGTLGGGIALLRLIVPGRSRPASTAAQDRGETRQA